MSAFVPCWYLLYTKPKQEKKLASYLKSNLIDHFLPTVKSLRQRGSKKKFVETAMFPSYVFVYVDNSQTFYSALNYEAALYYVRTGKKLACIEDQIVADLKIIAARGSEVEVISERFRPGEILTISNGLFAGRSCEIVEYKNERKVIVRMEWIGRNILAALGEECFSY